MSARIKSLFVAAAGMAAGCAEPQPTGTPIRVDPNQTRTEIGGSDDVLQVCQKMIDSMRRDPEVAAKPSKLIILDEDCIIVDPKLTGYNARLLYNELAAKLNRVAGQEFRFINRKAVSRERERQLKGEVKTSGVDAATAGADMVLQIELIATRGGNTTTVQYNFKLTDVSGGVDLWQDNDTVVKRS
jgi:PBP1b-binding outer membrane lipoprotein LpoB